MSRIVALLTFLWDFVVGDDWRIAAAVVVALVLTALISGAWYIIPVVVAATLTLSVLSVVRSR